MPNATMTADPRSALDRPCVVFVLPSFGAGGAERVTLNLARLIDRQRFAPSLVVLDPDGPLAAQVPADVPVHALGRRRLREATPALIACLRRLNPAVVISTFTYVNLPLLAARPLLRRARIVVREANLPSLSLSRMPWPAASRRACRWLYPRADLVIASSQRMADELCDMGVAPKNVIAMCNPVDEDRIRGSARPLQRKAGDGLRLVAAARLVPQKGFDRLLDAMAALPADSHLTILGEGPERTSLEQKITRLDLKSRVTLQGFVANPAPWIAGADALLVPSHFEGMPNAALEALALGTPVIATPEAGGLSEVEHVTIARFDAEFIAAMRNARVDPAVAPRPSMLPSSFRMTHVADQLNAMMGGLADEPDFGSGQDVAAG
jgi:glycosyltransferase involved in cell wall biosynthesis